MSASYTLTGVVSGVERLLEKEEGDIPDPSNAAMYFNCVGLRS